MGVTVLFEWYQVLILKTFLQLLIMVVKLKDGARQ
jgi:hypothetical protein